MIDMWIWSIFFGLLSISFALVLSIIIQKYHHKRKEKLNIKARDYLFSRYYDGELVELPCSVKFFIDAFIEVETQMTIEDDVRVMIEKDLIDTRFMHQKIRQLDHRSALKRKISIHYLEQIRFPKMIELLKERFFIEKEETVLFMLFQVLIHHLSDELINHLIKTLEKGSTLYQNWIYSLAVKHYNELKPFFHVLMERNEASIQLLLIKLGEEHLDGELKAYLMHQCHEMEEPSLIDLKAYEALSKMYPEDIVNDMNLHHQNDTIRRMTIHASSFNISIIKNYL